MYTCIASLPLTGLRTVHCPSLGLVIHICEKLRVHAFHVQKMGTVLSEISVRVALPCLVSQSVDIRQCLFWQFEEAGKVAAFHDIPYCTRRARTYHISDGHCTKTREWGSGREASNVQMGFLFWKVVQSVGFSIWNYFLSACLILFIVCIAFCFLPGLIHLSMPKLCGSQKPKFGVPLRPYR